MKPSHFPFCLIISFFGSILLTATAQTKETWHLTYDKGSGPVALGKDVILKLDSCKSSDEKQTTAYLTIENNARTLCAESRKDLHIESAKYKLTGLKESHDDIPVLLFEEIECTGRATSTLASTKDVVNDLLKAYSKSLFSVSKEKTTCVKETSLVSIPKDVFAIIARDLNSNDLVNVGQASGALHQLVADIPKHMLIDLSNEEISEARWNALFGKNGVFHNAQYINLTNAHMDASLLESLPKTTKMLISKNLRHRENPKVTVLSALDPNKLPELVHLEGLEFRNESMEDQEKLPKFKKLRRVAYSDMSLQDKYGSTIAKNTFPDLPLDRRVLSGDLKGLTHMESVKGVLFLDSRPIEGDHHLEINENVREVIFKNNHSFHAVAQVLKACPNIESIEIDAMSTQNNAQVQEFVQALTSLKQLKNFKTGEITGLDVLPPSVETLTLSYNANLGNNMKALEGKNIRRLKIERNMNDSTLKELTKGPHPELRELQIRLQEDHFGLENKFNNDILEKLSALPKMNHVYFCSQSKEGNDLIKKYEKAAKKQNLHLTFSVGCPNWEYELGL